MIFIIHSATLSFTFIDLHILNHLCFLGINPTCLWCMVLLMCFWIWFSTLFAFNNVSVSSRLSNCWLLIIHTSLMILYSSMLSSVIFILFLILFNWDFFLSITEGCQLYFFKKPQCHWYFLCFSTFYCSISLIYFYYNLYYSLLPTALRFNLFFWLLIPWRI
jgi:hypothetical protein